MSQTITLLNTAQTRSSFQLRVRDKAVCMKRKPQQTIANYGEPKRTLANTTEI